ncbi:MAG: ComF family protein [Patescibacteria group bacterium]
MIRGTLKIVTYPWNKIEPLIHLCLREIFGVSPDYHRAILDYWQKNGIYYYRPFRDTSMATICLLPYRHPSVHHGIYQMKYRNKTSYLPLFGLLIKDFLIDYLSETSQTHHFVDPILLVVPSSRKSIRTRGRHLTYELALHACKQGLADWVEYEPALLGLARTPHKQSRLRSKQARLANPRGAYRIKHPQHVFQRNIILLDDIYTTGATLDEISKILKQAGVSKITRITIAH